MAKKYKIPHSTASLSSKPSKNEKKLDKDVAKMFDKFPPKANKQ